MALTAVTKKAGAAFVLPRCRAKAADVVAAPKRWTLADALGSREFAAEMHRAIVAKGYSEADLARIVKEVRTELRSAKS